MILLNVEPEIWGIIQEQIFPVVLLAIAVWWFQARAKAQEAKIDNLYKTIIDDKEHDKGELMEVIRNHNLAMDRIAKIFEKLMERN